MMPQRNKMGLYVHWPFCLKKCPYCDFNSHVREQIDHDKWQSAYIRALEGYAMIVPKQPLSSIFFGGGTPSLMPAKTAEVIIETAGRLWGFEKDVEITLEANPTSVESQKFADFKLTGINRVSLGVQSFNEKDLRFLGREHSSVESLKALSCAFDHFNRVSFDLIYARPEQTLSEWEAELSMAMDLADNHISLYQLTIEKGTAFFSEHKQGKFIMPEESLAADFYELTENITSSNGLNSYEISNYALPGEESRHNLIYWHYDDYIGVGPGAHGRITVNERKQATREHTSPETWLSQTLENGSAAFPFEEVSLHESFIEGLMMGLRLTQGISLKNLAAKTGAEMAEIIDIKKIKTLTEEKLLVWHEENFHITPTMEGRMRLNAILPFILN